jgi:hypothetical protein
VWARSAGAARRYIDPKNNPADRRWIDVEVPLKTFAGQSVDLVLTTLPGPAGDINYDWAGWSGLRIVAGHSEPVQASTIWR